MNGTTAGNSDLLSKSRMLLRHVWLDCKGAERKDPSVISVTYGVSYAPSNTLKQNEKISILVPKGSNFGSERVKLWFRKGQTYFTRRVVPDRSNQMVPDRSKFFT
jgi:hypothetical protein